ncbi:glycoside hydrolase family 79 protein [Mycena galopus ATCC 62051]|nr:glycoside hydrolase family 79 protein [Mycena galopus ATCC 62051]
MSLGLRIRSLGFFLLLNLVPCQCEITVYHVNNQAPFTTTSVPAAEYSGVEAYNPSTLIPPPIPTPAIVTTIPVQLQNNGTPKLSITQSGAFMGFSIEMSVTNQIFGKNSTLLQVPFLNLMANLQQRAGSVRIRVGGNTQETAKLVDELPDNRVLQKNLTAVFGPTSTPPLDYTRELLYMMGNISSLVNVRWFLGIPWFVTQPFDLAIIPAAEEILGDYLMGLQVANEPDLYVQHQHRNSSYGPYDYYGEMSDFLTQLAASGLDVTGRAKQLLVAPNIAASVWTPEQVWNTGFVDTYSDNLAFLSMERYVESNCGAMIHDGEAILDPQTEFPKFLTHDTPVNLMQPYLNSTMYAQAKGKRLLMMETNNAACGGMLGVSNVFGAALWGLDHALQMAHSNFSGAMFHTAPPTAQSTFLQWSIGPLYYSALAMAEAMGPSNLTQVLDLGIQSPFTPIYGLYEDGVPVRVAAINYVDDPTGASDITTVISVSGGTVPAQVKVKYLAAASVSQQGNYTWAGQTLGGFFESDGRLTGAEDIQTVQCDTSAQTCSVRIPAPGFALIFLTDTVYSESETASTLTFPTTVRTQTKNTVTVNPSVLATSNGNVAALNGIGSTSPGELNAGRSLQAPMVLSVLFSAIAMGAALLMK